MGVEIIKSVDEFNKNSKQIKDDKKTATGTVPPDVSFSLLTQIYYDSFVVNGLTDKIVKTANGWFNTENKEIKNILNSIDFETIFKNKIINWNCFVEVIRFKNGKIKELIPFICEWVERMESGDWYIQKIWSQKKFFNQFTLIENRAEKISIREQSKARYDELVNSDDGCWYNPNLNEIFHFQNKSIKTRYYWESFYNSVFNQISLLKKIDDFYIKNFDKWMLKTILIGAKDWKRPLTIDDKKALNSFIKNNLQWLNKAFSTAIVDVPLEIVNLSQDINTTELINYRRALLESIAISLNVPLDLLLSDNSNRATSQVSYEYFIKNLILPFQNEILRDLKYIFKEDFKDIEDLDFIDLSNWLNKEQMEVLTGYKRNWILNKNEVRQSIWYNDIEWWDVFETSNDVFWINNINKKEKNFYNLLTEIENEFNENL